MIAIDSSALVAIPRRESEADLFLKIIAEADGCVVSSTSLLETSMVLAGRDGDAASWTELDELIVRARMQVVAQHATLVETAREAFLRYGKGRHPAGLNLGDSASYSPISAPRRSRLPPRRRDCKENPAKSLT